MDSPLANRIFRRLFAHDTCSRLRSQCPSRSPSLPQCQPRTFSLTAHRAREKKYGVKPTEQKSWQPRSELTVDDKLSEFKRYPMVTADELREKRERPRRVKMLMRDFIEGEIAPLKYIQTHTNFKKIVYTILTTATSPNKPSSSPLASPSTLAASKTNPNSSSNWASATLNSRTLWTKKRSMRHDSYGIHPQSSSVLTTATQWHGTWSQTTNSHYTHTTTS
jgi:hypothetical protein